MQAVIFDMDGVLCDTIDLHYRSWKKVAGDYDLPFTREDNEKLRGLTRKRSLEVLLKGKSLKDKEMDDILYRKNVYYLELVEKLGEKDKLPGVGRLINEIIKAELKLGVASASRNTRPVLERLGIASKIDQIVDGNTVQSSKPNPDVFLKTAEALNVNPGDCLVLEDSPAGVEAATEAGMCAVGIGSPELLSGAYRVYPDLARVSLADLQEVFKKWRIVNNPLSEGKTSNKKGMK
jgi:beta-phosphoglucomutase